MTSRYSNRYLDRVHPVHLLQAPSSNGNGNGNGNSLRVGDALELDPLRCELRRDGSRIGVQRKVLDVILYLAKHRERVVLREEIAQHLWPDVTVSAASLSTVIKDARRVLGDDGETQRFILTLRGRGFRWVAETTETTSTASTDARCFDEDALWPDSADEDESAAAATTTTPTTVARSVQHTKLLLALGEAAIERFAARVAEAAAELPPAARSSIWSALEHAGIPRPSLSSCFDVDDDDDDQEQPPQSQSYSVLERCVRTSTGRCASLIGPPPDSTTALSNVCASSWRFPNHS